VALKFQVESIEKSLMDVPGCLLCNKPWWICTAVQNVSLPFDCAGTFLHNEHRILASMFSGMIDLQTYVKVFRIGLFWDDLTSPFLFHLLCGIRRCHLTVQVLFCTIIIDSWLLCFQA
jgi:hypothetical protein